MQQRSTTTRQPSARLPLLLAGLGVAWLLFGLLVAPAVIAQAYRGEGLALVQELLAGYSSRSLGFLLDWWRSVVFSGALAFATLAGLAWLFRSPEATRRIVGAATPEALGAMRALVCGVLLLSTLWEDLASTAALPRDLIRPMGAIQFLYWLPGFEQLASSAPALRVLKWLTALALFLGMIGWKARAALPAAAVGYLLLGGLLRQYAWFYHTGLLPLYLLAILSLIPQASQGFTVERLVRRWRGEAVPPSDQPTVQCGWARYAVWMGLALPYVAAGLSKLRNGGLFWWDATNFKHILFYSTLRPMEFEFDLALRLASAPDAFFEALALAAVLGELTYGLVLFSKRARWVLPTLMIGMHLGILFLQNILFFDLILLQLIFFNFRPLRAAIAQRLTRWRPVSDRLRTVRGFVSSNVGAAPAAPAPRLQRGVGSPQLVLGLAGVLLFFWALRIEFYPFTGMQMFSEKKDSVVTYEVALAHLRSGAVIRAPIAESIGAVADSRYRRVLEMAFNEQEEDLAVEFMFAFTRRWNRKAPPEEQIMHVEVLRRRWDFAAAPDDPDHGRLIARRVYPSDLVASEASTAR